MMGAEEEVKVLIDDFSRPPFSASPDLVYEQRLYMSCMTWLSLLKMTLAMSYIPGYQI